MTTSLSESYTGCLPRTHELVSQISICHRPAQTSERNKLFSCLCRKFANQQDTVEERCFMLGLSIFCNQELLERIQYPRLNISFFSQWLVLKEEQVAQISSLDEYVKLFGKDEWGQIFDSMGIKGWETHLKECLGPMSPTVLKRLLYEKTIEGIALRALLSKNEADLCVRLRTEKDLECLKSLCTSDTSIQKRSLDSCLPRHLLQQIPYPALNIAEIELDPALVDVLVPKLKDNDFSSSREQFVQETLMQQISFPSARIIIGFSLYPGFHVYPNR